MTAEDDPAIQNDAALSLRKAPIRHDQTQIFIQTFFMETKASCCTESFANVEQSPSINDVGIHVEFKRGFYKYFII